MTQIKLSKRLAAIAALIPTSGGVIDVGTDHGFIPVWLQQNGHRGKILATDINPDPLENAIDTAIEYKVVDEISFFLCDGLKGICDKEYHNVIIAGMGGETIIDILSCALWTSQSDRTLILQPMTKADELRRWLQNNLYKVTAERLVEDGRLYEIMVVTGGMDNPYSPAELLTGHTELISADPLYRCRLDELITKFERVSEGLGSSSRPEDQKRQRNLIKLLEDLQLKKSFLYGKEAQDDKG